MAPKWQRPAGVPLPSVWRRYTGPKAMPDGRKPNFWIQDVTPDLDDQVVDFMCDSFLKEENFCSMAGVLQDPVSLGEIRAIWRGILQQRAALVALTDWPDGPGKPRLAGCNVTHVTLPNDRRDAVTGAPLAKVIRVMDIAEGKVDIFARYGVDAFLNALGLSVSPDFRGQDLGKELLLARDGLARALGLRVTIAVFSGVGAQKQSQRAGFELLAEMRYDDYRDEEGALAFPNAPCESFQLKAKRIE